MKPIRHKFLLPLWQKLVQASRRARPFFLSLAWLAIFLSLATSSVYGAPAYSRQNNPPASTDALPYVFSPMRVDAPKLFHWMSGRSLALDSSKRPRLAYGGDHLYYAAYDGTNWQITKVDNSSDVGMYASLALDSANNPHISYYDARNGALKYAHYTGSAWQIETVDSDPRGPTSAALESIDGMDLPQFASDQREWQADLFPSLSLTLTSTQPITAVTPLSATEPLSVDDTGVGLWTSIAVDLYGYPAISYYDAFGGDLKYAHWDGTTWVIQVVDSDYNVGEYSALALDSNGRPYISYFDRTNKDLRYAHWNGTKWIFSLVDDGGSAKDMVGQFTSITLDRNKRPHISYYNVTKGDLKYAKLSGGEWVIETVDSAGDVGKFTSIKLNDATVQRPFIAYYSDYPNFDLKYARFDSPNWVVTTIPLTGNLGRYASLVWVSNTDLRISFYDSEKAELKYAAGSASTWTVKTVDHAADVGLYSSLKFDSSNYPHISYFDDAKNDLKYAYYDGSAWQFQVVDVTGETGLFSSLALDSSNKAHISYYDYSEDAVKYAKWTGSAWQIQTVDASVGSLSYIDSGMGTSLVLDSSGRPRIAYFEGEDKNLKIALWTGSAWVYTVVDGEGGTDMGRYPSLAIDQNNKLYLSYFYNGNKHLRFAYLTAIGDLIDRMVADSDDNVGLYTAIAVSPDGGKVHIAYFDDTHDRLRYTWFDYTGWHWEYVGEEEITGLYPSIALGPADAVHIAYFNFSRRRLMYAGRLGGLWETTVVDNDGEVGLFPSLALDASGEPQISYYDRSNGDLKYAKTAPVHVNYPYFVCLPVVIQSTAGY